jgi:hypothetical protein
MVHGVRNHGIHGPRPLAQQVGETCSVLVSHSLSFLCYMQQKHMKREREIHNCRSRERERERESYVPMQRNTQYLIYSHPYRWHLIRTRVMWEPWRSIGTCHSVAQSELSVSIMVVWWSRWSPPFNFKALIDYISESLLKDKDHLNLKCP